MSEKITEFINIDLEVLVASFMENTLCEIAELESIIENKNSDEAYRMGHNIKGSALNYGFKHLAEIGRNIEIAGAEKDMGRVSFLYGQLQDYIKNVEIKFI